MIDSAIMVAPDQPESRRPTGWMARTPLPIATAARQAPGERPASSTGPSSPIIERPGSGVEALARGGTADLSATPPPSRPTLEPPTPPSWCSWRWRRHRPGADPRTVRHRPAAGSCHCRRRRPPPHARPAQHRQVSVLPLRPDLLRLRRPPHTPVRMPVSPSSPPDGHRSPGALTATDLTATDLVDDHGDHASPSTSSARIASSLPAFDARRAGLWRPTRRLTAPHPTLNTRTR